MFKRHGSTGDALVTSPSITIGALEDVKTTEDLRFWVRRHLRLVIPHACFLATVGRLHGLGSVPTHRLTADFPLSILEELKNASGAIVDPTVINWFKTSRLCFFKIQGSRVESSWNGVMSKYGMSNVMVHGTLHHNIRTFVLYQLTNVFSTDSVSTAAVFREMMPQLSKAILRVVANSVQSDSLKSYGDPTLLLTPAELHIVELLARGLSNKEIAKLRGVSDSTVKTQVQRTGSKLGATRRAEIVAIAMPFLNTLPPQSVIDYGTYYDSGSLGDRS